MLKLVSFLMAVTLAATNCQAVTLNILEWEGYISPYSAGFTAWVKSKHGLDVQLNFQTPYISNPEQIFEAVRSGQADVVTPTHNYYKMSAERLMKSVLPIDTAQLSNYGDVLSSLRTATYDTMDGRKYSVPLLGGSYALAYNADKTEAPDSWQVLWDSASKGTFSITEDQFEANVYLCMIMAGYEPTSFYDIDSIAFDEAKVQQLLNGLVANAHSFWPGMAQPKVMKELKYTTTYWFGVAAANKEGQNWKIASPKEGQTVWLDTLAIAKHVGDDAEKLKVAHLLIDYMISPEIQKQIHEDYGSMIVNAKAADLMSPEQVTAGRIGDETFWKEEWFWKPLTNRTRNMYKSMWDKAIQNAGK